MFILSGMFYHPLLIPSLTLVFKGTNAAIYSFIAFIAYARAIALGEKMGEAKDNRGKGGGTAA
jgi:hypothetical protein